MSTTRIRRSMNLAAFGFLSAAVGVVAWGWLSIPKTMLLSSQVTRVPKPDPIGASNKEADADAATKRQALIDSDFWSRPLRSGFQPQPVQTAPSNAEVAPTPPPPVMQFATTNDLGLRLVGTVLEEGESMAIAIDRQGKLDFRKQGESFQLMPEGVRVENVMVDSIRVSYQGQDSTWKLGESLAMQAEPMAAPEASSNTVVPPASIKLDLPAVPMSLDDELDLLNGN